MDDLSKYVPDVRFEKIPIKNLLSNQDYQRNLSVKHIQRTVDNFDIHQINPVKVSRRDGINYVFNGQHTIEIIAAVSGSRETPVWCMVFEDMDYQVEADTFANQQKNVKPLLPYEIFKANIEAGNDMQLMIKSLVESFDLVLGPTKGSRTICAISTLEEIYLKHGFDVLSRTLRLCAGTWEGEANSLSSNMLRGVCRLIIAFEDEMRDDQFKEKVGRFSAKEIARQAKDRRAGSLGYAEAMLLAYNWKMKNRLRWGKLFNKKGGKTADEYEMMDAEYDGDDDLEED